MGSVIDYIECSNCKKEAVFDYYYKTGEGYIHCPSCGYYRAEVIKNKDKKLTELTKEDWETKEYTKELNRVLLLIELESEMP